MRRPRLILSIALAVVLVAFVSTRSAPSDSFEVEAVFDTAKGMVPGQVVKIAGTRVGEITDLQLSERPGGGYKARMRLRISKRFAPFRSDASCKILPEGLISENYVECAPGSAQRRELARGPSGLPTVPVSRTSASVSLQDVLNTFSMPTDQRIRLFFDTLGLGTAGRGEDLNAVIRRANPSLAQARKFLTVLGDQNQRLSRAVVQTDDVVASLADRRDDVRAFVARTASVARTTAGRRRALGETVRRLPGTLDATKAGLREFEKTTRGATPLLAELKTSAPTLLALTDAVKPFADAAIPAVRSIGDATAKGTAAVPDLRKVVRNLRAFGKQAPATATLVDQFLINSQQRGAIEGVLRALYGLSTFSANYDGLSHYVGLTATLFPDCILANQQGTDVAGCTHAYRAARLGRVPVNAPAVDPGPHNSVAVNSVGEEAARKAREPRRALSGAEVKKLLEAILR